MTAIKQTQRKLDRAASATFKGGCGLILLLIAAFALLALAAASC